MNGEELWKIEADDVPADVSNRELWKVEADDVPADVSPFTLKERKERQMAETTVDQIITCNMCDKPFTWRVGEQIFFKKKDLSEPPKRCKKCRAHVRAMVKTKLNLRKDFLLKDQTGTEITQTVLEGLDDGTSLVVELKNNKQLKK